MLPKPPMNYTGEIPWDHRALGGGRIFQSQDKGSPAFWQGPLDQVNLKNQDACFLPVSMTGINMKLKNIPTRDCQQANINIDCSSNFQQFKVETLKSNQQSVLFS